MPCVQGVAKPSGLVLGGFSFLPPILLLRPRISTRLFLISLEYTIAQVTPTCLKSRNRAKEFPMSQQKQCSKCKQWKDKTAFYPSRFCKHRCKDCNIAYHRNYREKNKEKLNEQARKRYQKKGKNEKKRILQKKAEYRKKWYEKNKEKISQQRRTPKYKAEERKRRKARSRRERYTKKPQALIARRLRNRISRSLRRQKTTKTKKSLDLLGCSVAEYRIFLEAQFSPPMSWQNYGFMWHIDHIKPISSFDLTDPKQQLEAFHYSNTRPLSAKENMSKGSKTLEEYEQWKQERTNKVVETTQEGEKDEQ